MRTGDACYQGNPACRLQACSSSWPLRSAVEIMYKPQPCFFCRCLLMSFCHQETRHMLSCIPWDSTLIFKQNSKYPLHSYTFTKIITEHLLSAHSTQQSNTECNRLCFWSVLPIRTREGRAARGRKLALEVDGEKVIIVIIIITMTAAASIYVTCRANQESSSTSHNSLIGRYL